MPISLSHECFVTFYFKDNSSVLIEAAKGGHTSVALLLINTQMQTYIPPERPVRNDYPLPPTALPVDQTAYHHMCSHMQHSEHMHQMQHQPTCHFHCAGSQDSCDNTQQEDCLSSPACAFVDQPIIIPTSMQPSNDFQQQLPDALYDNGESFKVDTNLDASPTDLYLPNIPVSLATSLSLANLTPADLQSLAQALSFSTTVNQTLSHDESETIHNPGTITESIGLASNITFPIIDPQIESFTTQSEVCTPSPSNTATALVTSAGRTITSTGVQTEDAISMIQKLTNSVHQLNALQTFAATHNLELVNLGEITLPPAPFQLEGEQEEEEVIPDPATAAGGRSLHNSMTDSCMVREGNAHNYENLSCIVCSFFYTSQNQKYFQKYHDC